MRASISSDCSPRFRSDRGGGKLYTVAVLLWILVGVVITAAIVGTNWWVQDAPLNTFNPKGENAQIIMDLVLPVFIVAGIVFVGVEVGILVLSLKRRKDVDEWETDTDFPEQSHGNTKLELLWTATPAVVLAVLAVMSVTTILDLNDFEDTDLVIQVEGQQWWWQFEYDNNGDGEYGGQGDIITASEMVIPAGSNVEVRVTSNDVIHSFWIPELNGKKDAVPGMSSRWKIQADEPGRYRGQCTEFCGLSHARMQMYVIALSPEDYEAWEQNQLQPAVELTEDDFDTSDEFAAWESGKELFTNQCTACHTIDGVGAPANGFAAQVSGTAPNLTHLMSRDSFAGAILPMYVGVQDTLIEDTPVDNYVTKDGQEPDVNNLEEWLRNPLAVKPMDPYQAVPNPHGSEPPTVGRGMPNMGLTEEQIDDLVAYLTTLK